MSNGNGTMANMMKLTKKQANFFYYSGITIIFVTHIWLAWAQNKAGAGLAMTTPKAVWWHVGLNLFAAVLVAISWFGFCNNKKAVTMSVMNGTMNSGMGSGDGSMANNMPVDDGTGGSGMGPGLGIMTGGGPMAGIMNMFGGGTDNGNGTNGGTGMGGGAGLGDMSGTGGMFGTGGAPMGGGGMGGGAGLQDMSGSGSQMGMNGNGM